MSNRARAGPELTARAWRLVHDDGELRRLAARAYATTLAVALLAVGGGAFVQTRNVWGERPVAVSIGGPALLLGGASVAAFIVVRFNVQLAAAVEPALRGHAPDLPGARQVARARIGAIAGWALLSSLATLVLGFVRLVGMAGIIMGGYWAARWSLVTNSVVPIMVKEGRQSVDAVRRSTQLVRDRWGPKAIGDAHIGGGEAARAGIGVCLLFVGMALLVPSSVVVNLIGAVVVVICIGITVRGAIHCGASRAVFGVALHRYLADGEVIGTFTAAELERAGTIADHPPRRGGRSHDVAADTTTG